MYSEFERQKDKRSYNDCKKLYVGPLFGYPAERVKPTKQLVWGEDGLPQYVNMWGVRVEVTNR
jgi:troponin T, fast skeletal muscle